MNNTVIFDPAQNGILSQFYDTCPLYYSFIPQNKQQTQKVALSQSQFGECINACVIKTKHLKRSFLRVYEAQWLWDGELAEICHFITVAQKSIKFVGLEGPMNQMRTSLYLSCFITVGLKQF